MFLRLEEYALLAGSVGLFLALALVMLLTRRVNWYELRLGTEARFKIRNATGDACYYLNRSDLQG